MSLVNSFETSLLGHIFQNLALPNVGDATGLPASAGAGNIYVSLHTADPGEAAANQGVSEMTYTGYGRKTGVRSSSGWTVSGNTVDNAALISMGENTGSSQTSTHFGLGFASTGTTALYMTGTAALVVGANVNPQFAIGALDVSLD
jgi:hypothetical protein